MAISVLVLTLLGFVTSLVQNQAGSEEKAPIPVHTEQLAGVDDGFVRLDHRRVSELACLVPCKTQTKSHFRRGFSDHSPKVADARGKS